MHIFFTVFCVYTYLSSFFFLLLLNCCISSNAKTSAIQRPILAPFRQTMPTFFFFSVINTQKLLPCTYRAVFHAFFFTHIHTWHNPAWHNCPHTDLAHLLTLYLSFPVFTLLASCKMRKKQHVSGRPNIYHLLCFSVNIIFRCLHFSLNVFIVTVKHFCTLQVQ